MKLNRKTVVSVFMIILFMGSILISVANFYMPVQTMKETIVMETTSGNIEIELDLDNAPITANNFMRYVNEGFYDGLVFHRVIPGFMVQGGGFYPDGTQKQTHSPIQLESNNGLKNERGTIAMARTSEPDSATSQFFINVVDNNFLNYQSGSPGYAVFGKVVSGMNVIDEIVNKETTEKPTPYGPMRDWPIEDVIISKAYVKEPE
jgi:cyclophilin family peptidyl-prolyl cis-trans isomerase